ncbi:unnamed protein product [Peronospora farinosa]|uniref:Uncharacterized protein n=1 Tax=Peronospora farinosa TaxID=134698 RepID=A0ABN8C2F7_9STRA|nr:unnamed protein product [Peronospora farinosa]
MIYKVVAVVGVLGVSPRVKYQGKEQDDREARGVGYTRASKKHRHIAPNASALESIVLGTARSRDRMDERERARAKKKLKDLNATAKTSETFTVDKAVKMDR